MIMLQQKTKKVKYADSAPYHVNKEIEDKFKDNYIKLLNITVSKIKKYIKDANSNN